jgi:hypothetical protein
MGLFSQVFTDTRYSWAIVLEDDLEVAPDFFNYMIAGAALLRKDPTLWTVTAWNDNGTLFCCKGTYFSTYNVLRKDPTLWTVTAWNGNGTHVHNYFASTLGC